MRADASQPPLVGRDSELDALITAVATCAGGGSVVVTVGGDPGLGKTALLDELGRLAGAAGLPVLRGRATPVGRAVPGDSPVSRAVDGLRSAAGGRRAVVLCLDDLHAADDDDLAVLSRLLRRPPTGALLVAGAYRPRQVSGALETVLRDTAAGFRTVHLAPAALDQAAATRLFGDGPALRHLAASGGNPLYLRVACELERRGGDPAALPEDLRTALTRDLAPVHGDQLAVLRAAAVLGDPFDPLLLAPVAELDERAALAALDGLAARDLVRSDGSHHRLTLRHTLVRVAVVRRTPPGWWIAANARADRALHRCGAGPLARAPHLARAARPGDATAVAVLTEAATRATPRAPAAAAAWLRAALRLRPEPPADPAAPARIELLLALARASAATGDPAGCRAALIEAAELAPIGRRAGVVALCSATQRLLGDPGGAELVARTELARWAPADPGADPVRLQLAVAGLGVPGGGARRLAALAERATDARTRTAVAICRALDAGYRGHTPQLCAALTGATPVVDGMADAPFAAFLDEVCQLAWAEIMAGRHADAIRHTGRAVRAACGTGQRHLLPHLLICRAYAQLATGDLAGATAAAGQAHRAAHLLHLTDLAAGAQALHHAAAALRDDPTAGPAVGAPAGPDRPGQAAVAELAAVRLDQGRADDCAALLRPVVDRDDAATHALQAGWFGTAARAAMVLGDPAAARDWAGRAARVADVVGLPGPRGHALLAQAVVTGADPVAAGQLSAAAAAFATAGLVPAEIRARLLLGRVLVDLRQLDEAAASVGEAKNLADAYGAARLAVLAVNVQRRIGAGRSRGCADVLSEQERRICALVAAGLTNRDVARELYISVKTVEGHLTRIFRKLRVTSRAALTAVAV
ncbi:yhcZ-like transcriptional regulatory protein [Actinoplanes sp. SE50]|nr:yhcZ-like uncharacterized transcriptional regulatory protein [Actinoplanes sp. SE50/110]ATO83822.1 yhcZ-like transcriptional regulatory protein [Actinoplanes sp. SE50]SLM01230.1 LuxR-family transcriptional regulator [Actinoplanes sp. SE50/110]